MTDDPKRVPDDPRIKLAYSDPRLRSVPVVGTLNVDEGYTTAQLRENQKAHQLQKLQSSIELLHLTSTPAGGGFILGVARGRLAALHDLGLINDQEFADLKNTIKATFNRHWPELRIDDTPGVH